MTYTTGLRLIFTNWGYYYYYCWWGGGMDLGRGKGYNFFYLHSTGLHRIAMRPPGFCKWIRIPHFALTLLFRCCCALFCRAVVFVALFFGFLHHSPLVSSNFLFFFISVFLFSALVLHERERERQLGYAALCYITRDPIHFPFFF